MSISLIISIISLLFGSGVFVTGLHSLKKALGKVDSIAYGTKCALKDRLLQSYRHHEALGYMPYDEKEVWLDCYSAYHTLGGNGVMTKYKDKILNLPDSLDDAN